MNGYLVGTKFGIHKLDQDRRKTAGGHNGGFGLARKHEASQFAARRRNRNCEGPLPCLKITASEKNKSISSFRSDSASACSRCLLSHADSF
jgi:hypothetical protein